MAKLLDHRLGKRMMMEREKFTKKDVVITQESDDTFNVYFNSGKGHVHTGKITTMRRDYDVKEILPLLTSKEKSRLENKRSLSSLKIDYFDPWHNLSLFGLFVPKKLKNRGYGTAVLERFLEMVENNHFKKFERPHLIELETTDRTKGIFVKDYGFRRKDSESMEYLKVL